MRRGAGEAWRALLALSHGDRGAAGPAGRASRLALHHRGQRRFVQVSRPALPLFRLTAAKRPQGRQSRRANQERSRRSRPQHGGGRGAAEMIDPRTPVLVGCGQITDLAGKPSSERSRVAFCAEAARVALADSGASIGAEALGRKIDALAVLEFFSDISPRFASPFGRSSNPPRSVANRLDAPPRQLLYSHSGGNMPQYLVNRFAEEIANGETELALICGAELLRSTQNARRAGQEIDGNEDPGVGPIGIGDKRFGFSDEEARHELRAAIHFYPLLENAIRGGLKRDVDRHMKAMGRLFERLAAVAKDNPLATRRKGFSAEELSTISDHNRWICFPYPRLMNANAIIDQAAAILVTSVGKAREWGIPQERWVFLHGCADGTDTWVVSERERLDTSPAINGCARHAL